MKFLGCISVMIMICFSCFAQQNNQWITGDGNIIDFNISPAISYMQCDTFDIGWYLLVIH